jgi:hypothetical protein
MLKSAYPASSEKKIIILGGVSCLLIVEAVVFIPIDKLIIAISKNCFRFISFIFD